MTNLESLRSLQKRIREAKEADRELDALICAALRYSPGQSIDHYIYKFPVWRGRKDGRVEVVHESGDGGAHFCVPQLTLDPDGLGPCVALMRAKFPEWRWAKTASGRYRVFRDDGSLSEADPLANDCLTFLDAIFSAAIAQEEAKEKAGA